MVRNAGLEVAVCASAAGPGVDAGDEEHPAISAAMTTARTTLPPARWPRRGAPGSMDRRTGNTAEHAATRSRHFDGTRACGWSPTRASSQVGPAAWRKL